MWHICVSVQHLYSDAGRLRDNCPAYDVQAALIGYLAAMSSAVKGPFPHCRLINTDYSQFVLFGNTLNLKYLNEVCIESNS